MDIATVKSLRTKLEIDLRNAAHALCDDFQAATGVQVASVSISILEAASIGGAKKSYVSNCTVDLEL